MDDPISYFAPPIRSEEDFLRLIDRHFPREHQFLALGRGDDAAVLRASSFPDAEFCLSTDLFLEDVHFRRRYFSPADIGHKALAVNLSDMAGMGAEPTGFCLSLMAPKAMEPLVWDQLMAGMANLSAAYNTPLAGGDLSRSSILGLSITVWGRKSPSGRFLTRAGGKPGDALFVVAPPAQTPGLARIGLAVLETDAGGARNNYDKITGARERFPSAVAAHLRPAPLVEAGLALTREPGVRSLMDVSDGLARDLPRLLGGQYGAALQLPKGLLHPEVLAGCEGEKLTPQQAAVLGGEDYILLGAADQRESEGLGRRIRDFYVIGEVTEQPGMTLDGQPFTAAGFDHFGE